MVEAREVEMTKVVEMEVEMQVETVRKEVV